MKKLIIVALMVLPCWLLAQEYQYVPFPDSGAVWSEMYTSEEEGVVYERFTVTGEDTLINDISYKKLYIFYDKVFDKSSARCVGGIREDENKRVYFKGEVIHPLYKPLWHMNPPLDELLMYDFSCKVGDTICLYKSHDNYDVISIDSINTIQIGNSLRRVFCSGFFVKWIEGIGCTRGLLFSSGGLPTGGENGNLICFLQDDTLQYHDDFFDEFYDDCFPMNVDAGYKKLDYAVDVCPNPVSGSTIRFEWGNNTLQTIEIFNFKGVLIGSANVIGVTSMEYPAEALQPGIYLYRATGPGGEKQTGKFVVP